MATAKEIRLEPIKAARARRFVRENHYSGKTVNNSQLHLGVFLNGILGGVMQFGPSLDKRKIQGLVKDTPWNGFMELNRMAFSERLPRNSESRAIAIAMRLIRKNYPHIQWVISFADATQCGDGTIYRASGFALTGIKENGQIVKFPDGLIETRFVLTDARRPRRVELAKRYGVDAGGGSTLKPFIDIGCVALEGHQLRYVYFIHPTAKDRLAVPILPYSKIDEMGAGMYKGVRREKQAMAGPPAQRRGSTDLHAPNTGGEKLPLIKQAAE